MKHWMWKYVNAFYSIQNWSERRDRKKIPPVSLTTKSANLSDSVSTLYLSRIIWMTSLVWTRLVIQTDIQESFGGVKTEVSRSYLNKGENVTSFMNPPKGKQIISTPKSLQTRPGILYQPSNCGGPVKCYPYITKKNPLWATHPKHKLRVFYCKWKAL